MIMKRTFLDSSALLVIAFALSSCTKVIDINLNAAAPKLVIEGNISDQPSSCIVKLSTTVNFDESNTFPPVTGAVITLSDNSGNAATLSETSPGIYTTSSMQAVIGRAYTLSVTTGGNTYTAISTVPNAVNIDTLTQDSISTGFGSSAKETKYVNVLFNDPAGINNYYRFVEIINGAVSDAIFIDDDRLRDGFTITDGLFQRDSTLHTGDGVTVLLQSIDKGVFNYFTTFLQLTGGGRGGQTATPANPVSNINGGALGYFSAYSVRSKSIVIQ